MLTKEQILSTDEQKVFPVPVKEWKGTVGVKVMSARERDAWELAAFSDGKVNKENFRATLLVHVLCDEDGNPLFTEADIATLSDRPSPAIVRLARKAMKLNGLSDDDVDELTKN